MTVCCSAAALAVCSTETTAFKEDFLKHPLWPVVRMLWGKCELATAELLECAAEETFCIDDIHSQLLCISQTQLGASDQTTTELMQLFVQVLRLQLLELQRVRVLVTEFLQRYCTAISQRVVPLLAQVACAAPTAAALHQPAPSSSPSSSSSSNDSLHRVCSPSQESPRTPLRHGLPAAAVDMLKQWLFLHSQQPYPSESEKRQLCQQTGLNVMQLNNWFINARRRLLQPVLNSCSLHCDGS